MSKKQLCDLSVYEWQESQFLKSTQIILSLASILGIHKIKREKGKILYLVPEEYYLECKKRMAVKSTDSDED